jgi:hypothetical protein
MDDFLYAIPGDEDADFEDMEDTQGFLVIEDLEDFSCDSSICDIVRIWSDGDDSRYSE